MLRPESLRKRYIKDLFTFYTNFFHENSFILLIVFLYSIAALVIRHFLTQPYLRGNTLDLGYLFTYLPSIISLIFLSKILTRFKQGFEGLRITYNEILENHFNLKSLINLISILIVVPVFLLSYHTFKILIPSLNPFSWDLNLMKLDYAIHLGNHPWSLIQPLLGYPEITRAIDYCYHHVWGGVLFTIVLAMAWSPRHRLRKQFFLTFLSTWIILGTIFATAFSSAGPCYFDYVTTLHNPYGPLMEYLNTISGLASIQTQKLLWDFHAMKIPMFYTGISAMPSMHVAAAVLCSLVGWHLNRAMGLVLGSFAAIIQIGSVHLGWHYAVDGYVSATITILIWKWMGRLCKVL